MRSALPKVLQPLAGRPLLAHVIDLATALAPAAIYIVHGHGGERVRGQFSAPSLQWVPQAEQLGTGHALAQALPSIPDEHQVLVLYGDVPLLRPTTLRALLELAGAAGMALAWQDQFATLNATPCKPATGVWPNCTAPTASDGFTYLENIGNGSDYGDCAFEHTDGKYNPYTVQSGFLRIRATYDPYYHDPYGYNRKWYCGLLRTAFADGSSNLPAISYGYFEFTILAPNAAAATGATGGTWPAVWQTTRRTSAGCSGHRTHPSDSNSRRITPSLCSDLISDKDSAVTHRPDR